MVFNRIYMSNPYQKTILIEQPSRDLIEICKKFQDDSDSSNSEVKSLLREVAILWDTKEN